MAAVDAPSQPLQEEAEEDTLSHEPAPRSAIPSAAASKGTKTAKNDEIKMWAASELDAKKKKKKGTLGIGNSSLFFASESDKAPVQKISVLSIVNHSIENKGRQLNLELDEEASAQLPSDAHGSLRFALDKKGEADEVWNKVEDSQEKARIANQEPDEADEVALAPQYPASTGLKSSHSVSNDPLPSLPSRASILPPPTRTAAATRPKPNEPEPEPEPEPVTEQTGSSQTQAEEQAIALYDFEAQGDDELTVTENEELILVERETDDWWKVRNVSGREGVVPASYVEVHASTGAAREVEDTGADEHQVDPAVLAAQQEEEEQRLREEEEEANQRALLREEQRKKVEAQRRAREAEDRRRQALKAQPAPQPPKAPASSSVASASAASRDVSIPSNRSAPARPKEAGSKSKPSPSRTRVWHDRTGQFKVEAEFLGFNQGKIRLHKLNGVVIEVAIEKMSNADIAYLEDITGRKLKPSGRSSKSSTMDDSRRLERRKEQDREHRRRQEAQRGPKRNIDWFEFFLASGVDIDDCTRYASNFERDKIDESILPDMDASILRSVGLREGDIIRVMKFIQKRYHKDAPGSAGGMSAQLKSDEALARKLQEQEQAARRNGTTPPPNLFSGPDGSLKNNTRRGRPTTTTARTTSDSVDAASFAAASETLAQNTNSPPRTRTTSPQVPKASPAPIDSTNGFDDDAWTPRPSSAKAATPKQTVSPQVTSATPPPQPPRPSVAVSPAPASPAPQQQSQAAAPPAATSSATVPDTASSVSVPDPNSALFDKLAAMKPPSTGVSQRPGASPVGANSLYNGVRGPYAPVAQNSQMLQPLVPTQGTGQFNPTALGHQNTGMAGMGMQPTGYMPPSQTGFLQQQQTGFMQPQQTGFNGYGMGMSSVQSPFGMQSIAPQQTGYVPGPNQQPIPPQQTSQQYSSQQQQRQNDEANRGPERFSAANVFGQMKQGHMHKEQDSAPQSAQRYDALRPQPTGFQPGGYLNQQYTGYGGYPQY